MKATRFPAAASCTGDIGGHHRLAGARAGGGEEQEWGVPVDRVKNVDGDPVKGRLKLGRRSVNWNRPAGLGVTYRRNPAKVRNAQSGDVTAPFVPGYRSCPRAPQRIPRR